MTRTFLQSVGLVIVWVPLGAVNAQEVTDRVPPERFANYFVMREAGNLSLPDGTSLPLCTGDLLLRLKSSQEATRVVALALGEIGTVEEARLVELRRAADYFSGILRERRNQPEIFLGRARVWDALGQYRLALMDASDASDLEPNEAMPYLCRSESLSNLVRRADALRDLNDAVAREPRNASILVARGWAQCAMWKIRAAGEDFSLAAELAPTSPLPILRRAQMYQMCGDYAKAKADFVDATAKFPRNILVQGGYALLLATANDAAFRDPQRATELSQLMVDATEGKYGDALLLLADAYAAAGNFERAIASAEAALKAVVPRAQPAVQQSLAAFRKGEARHIP